MAILTSDLTVEAYNADYRVLSRIPWQEAELRRDRNMCAYCGGYADTVDHVLPRCRGGGDSWFNLVAACRYCNGLKGDRTPQEAGMSQTVFALTLNVTPSLVSQWERGEKKPSGPSLKLLNLADKKGVEAIL